MKPHQFTPKEIKKAEHDFATIIKQNFGEVWKIKVSASYVGKQWDCRRPHLIASGLWHLVTAAKHAGAKRASGRLELKDTGSLLVFTLLYDDVRGQTK